MMVFGAAPSDGVAALRKRPRQSSLPVANAVKSEPSVSKLASVVFCVLLIGSRMTLPHPPVKADDIILSRVKGRTSAENVPILLRVLSEVGTGEFHGFEAPRHRDEDGKVWRSADETVVIGALDLANAEIALVSSVRSSI